MSTRSSWLTLVLLVFTLSSVSTTFAQGYAIDSLGTTHSVYLDDIDANGLTDIIAWRFNTSNISLYEQTSVGQFGSVTELDAGVFIGDLFGGMTLVDIDADGHKDIFLIGVPSWGSPLELEMSILLSDGQGNFTIGDPGTDLPSGWQFDQDFYNCSSPTVGRSSSGAPTIKFLATHNEADGQYSRHLYELFIEDGSQQISALGLITPENGLYADAYFFEIHSVQLDDDIEEETIWSHQLFNTYDPTDGSLQFSPIGTMYSNEVTHIDIDQDGDQDIIDHLPTYLGQGAYRLYLNDGSGLLSDGGTYDGPVGRSADLDGDGDPDIVDIWGTTHLNDGNGEFTSLGQVDLPNNSFYYIALYDMSVPFVHLGSDTDPGFSVLINRDGSAPVPSGLYYVPTKIGCPQVLSTEGHIDVDDFLPFNSVFGQACNDCPQDINGDGMVDIDDFLTLNSAFGGSCE